ncbi:hypothetical protein ACFVUN_34645 [Kitasatospora griseola]|uniref:hypothetical protein n=1 Tax=Kitasatospora griseola TaxID=2064 RepID=UPI0036DA9D47
MTNGEHAMDEETRALLDTARHVVEALAAAHRLLGREDQALLDLQAHTASAAGGDRAATLRRMRDRVGETARHLATGVGILAQFVGMVQIGIDGQYSQRADGKLHTPLAALDSRDYLLSEAVDTLVEAIDALRAAYAPTRKHPGLTRPQDRQAMAQVVGHLLDAAREMETMLGTDQADIESYTANVLEQLALLERICQPLPDRPDAAMSDDAAVQRVLMDPELTAKVLQGAKHMKVLAPQTARKATSTT